MNVLRQHWFDIGLGLALITGAFLAFSSLSPLLLLLWINLIALFFHQFEEYRYPGYFPGMMNKVMFSNPQPGHADRRYFIPTHRSHFLYPGYKGSFGHPA